MNLSLLILRASPARSVGRSARLWCVATLLIIKKSILRLHPNGATRREWYSVANGTGETRFHFP